MPEPAAPKFYMEVDSPHLGGYIVGGDPATYYPQLWESLVHSHGIRSVVDVGCGEGHAARFFAERDCHVIGIDGIQQPSEKSWQFVLHDYTKGSWPDKVRGNRMESATDLVWSCEFVEHIEERYVPNFLETFLMGSMVLMTHAEPNQPGYHHVNCRTADYWIGAMAAVGFQLDEGLTYNCRGLARMNRNAINHFARSGLAFRRR